MLCTRRVLTMERIGGLTWPEAQRAPDDIRTVWAEVIYRYARPHLGSREVDVFVDLPEMRGSVLVGGFRTAGTFTIELIEDAPAVTA